MNFVGIGGLGPMAAQQLQAQQRYLEHAQNQAGFISYGAAAGMGGSGGAGAGALIYDGTQIEFQPPKKSKGTIMESLKKYIENNRDLIFNVGFLIILDHFIFDGAFREKLKSLVEKMFSKAEKHIEGK